MAIGEWRMAKARGSEFGIWGSEITFESRKPCHSERSEESRSARQQTQRFLAGPENTAGLGMTGGTYSTRDSQFATRLHHGRLSDWVSVMKSSEQHPPTLRSGHPITESRVIRRTMKTPHPPSSVGHPLPLERAEAIHSYPLPAGEGGPRPAFSSAGAGRVRGRGPIFRTGPEAVRSQTGFEMAVNFDKGEISC